MSDAEEQSFREMFPLVIAGLAGLALVFLVAGMIIASATDNTYVPAGMTRAEVVAQRIKPVGEVNMGGPKVAAVSSSSEGGSTSAAASVPDSPKALYKAVCSACHATGVAGAPKFGDTAEWKPRLSARGIDTLHQHALNGYKGMPAKGGHPELPDDLVKNTVNFMLKNADLSP